MKRIVSYITEKVKDRLDSSKFYDFVGWLENLEKGGPSDQRLLCCLGIELKYKLIDIDILINVFKKIDYINFKGSNAAHLFESALRDDSILHAYGLELSDDFANNEQFVRIMTLDTFNSYFYNRIEGIDDVKLANDKLMEVVQRGELDSVRMPNDGPPFRKCAWITPFSKIQKIIGKCKLDGSKVANEITNALGLGIDPTASHYILIEYPKNFSEITYQPCSVNSNWYDTESKPGLFISFEKYDKYGRTRTRYNDDETVRLQERIHKPINSKYVYNISYIGQGDDFECSITTIGNESLLRFLHDS